MTDLIWATTAEVRGYPGCGIPADMTEDVLGQYPHPVYGTLGTGETYSFHTGGANVAFGDCSVRLLRSSIPVRTFAALVTRAGGEVVSDPD